MSHFIKYLLLTAFLFLILNLFRSNMEVVSQLRFELPLIWTGETPPLSLNYLLLVSFTLGILFSAATGGFHFFETRRKLKQLQQEKKDLELLRKMSGAREHDLPSLSE